MVMWNNDTTAGQFNRNMSEHRIVLRGENHHHTEQGTHTGLTCSELHLDQVFIVFRPTANITATEFTSGDSANINFRAETIQLLVRTQPGYSHVFYFVPGDTADHLVSAISPIRRLLYSNAYTVTPDMEGAEDYWCRTYRPVRDNPIAVDMNNISDLSIELIFPLLTNVAWNNHVPNYRILTVMCEFSTV